LVVAEALVGVPVASWESVAEVHREVAAAM
jgi:hypothetical protein